MAEKEETKCVNCKKSTHNHDTSADIEYVDTDFSLVVSSKSVKHSKEIFNEIFEKVKSNKVKKNHSYIA